MRRFTSGCAFVCLCVPPFAAAQTSQHVQAPVPALRDAAKLIANLPVHFEAAPGDHGAHQYTASGPGYRVDLVAASIHVGLIRGASATPQGRESAAPAPPITSTVSMNLIGASPSAPGTALEPFSSTSSYFLGSNPSAWRSGEAQFGRLLFSGVYPGIDVAYYGNGSQLEHDFIVHAGSDPASIRLAFPAQHPQLDPEGALVLSEPADRVRLLKPVAYQPAGNGVARKEVECHFRLAANGDVVFALGAFDHTRALVIDPTLSYASYFGNYNTVINGISVDASGNIFIAGLAPTYGITTKNAPLSAGTGTYNAFLAKLDPTGGNILFSTYIGGNTQDEALTLALDPSGNAYIAGLTQSTNFPTLHAAQTAYGVSSCYSSYTRCFNGFVTAVKSDGSALLYSTYLGGNVDDRVEGIAVDATGAAYLTGYTKSGNFPLKNAYQTTLNTNCSNPSNGSCQDAFVTKLDNTGALVFSTYLGGTGADNGVALALDSAKNIYVTGSTGSSNFPQVGTLTYNGSALSLFSGAFVTEMAGDGQSLVFSHLLATGQADAIALDSSGIYVAGSITSDINATVPTTNGAYSTSPAEMYALKLTPDGSGFLYGTYLGGLSGDLPTALAVDASGDAWIAGYTTSTTYPTTGNALQPAATGGFVRSTDGGTTFAGSSSGLPTCTPTFISLDPATAGHILTNCLGNLYLSTNAGASWSALTTTGLSGAIVSGFRTLSSSTTLYVLTTSGVYKSTDNGITWAKGTGTGLPTLNGTSQTIVGDPTNADVIYFTQASVGQPFVFRSSDGGATWTSVSTGLPSSGNLSFLVPDTTNAGTLYAAIGTKVYKTTNSGDAWTLPNTTGVPYYIVGLSLDPSNTSTVYVGTTFSYFKSTDGATTFTAGNSSFFVNTAIVVDPANSNTLYARLIEAGYYAIEKSTDGGTTFTPTPFTNTSPNIVVIDPTSPSNVYVGTSPTPTAFLSELDPNGANLLYSSFYGGIGWTEFWALALSGSNIYAAGLTNSANNNTTNNGAQPSLASHPAQASLAPSTTTPHPEFGFGIALSTFDSLATGPFGGFLLSVSPSTIQLTLSDVASTTTPVAGGSFQYDFTLGAVGGTAMNVTFNWSPPIPGIFIGTVSFSSGSCSQTEITVTCSFGAIAPGHPVTISIDATVEGSAPLSPTQLFDNAVAGASNAPSVTASAPITVTASASLSLDGTINKPKPFLAFGSFKGDLIVSNAGPSKAFTPTVTISASNLNFAPDPNSCPGGSTATTPVNPIATCVLNDIPSGGSVTIALNGAAGSPTSGSANFMATSSDSPSAYANITLQPIVAATADLQLTGYLYGLAASAKYSAQTGVHFDITNLGNSTAYQPVLTITLSPGYFFTIENSANIDFLMQYNCPGGYTFSGGGFSSAVLKCTQNALPVNGRSSYIYFTIGAPLGTTGTVTVDASVTSATPDPDTSNNTLTLTGPYPQPTPQTVVTANASGSVAAHLRNGAASASVRPQLSPSPDASGLALDQAGDIWVAAGASVIEYNAAQSLLGTFTGGGLGGSGNGTSGIAIDGNGSVWIANTNGSITQLDSSGDALSPSTGYTGGGLSQPSAIAVDSAGTLWIANPGNNSVTRIFGAASPIATPLSVDNANSSFGVKP